MAILVILFNLYFVLTVWKVEELHTHDYVLITIQCAMDLIFTGVFGLLHYLLELWSGVVSFCIEGDFLGNT